MALVEQLGRWADAGVGDPPAAIAAVVALVAGARGVDVDLVIDDVVVEPDPAMLAAGVDLDLAVRWGPWLPGLLREALTSAVGRRGLGVHHTPPAVVAEVLDLAERSGLRWGDSTSVLDPSVGGGAFLLAAAERLPGSPEAVVERLCGVDVDPLAVATTRAALTLWAGVAPPLDRVVVGDFLDVGSPSGPVDVVVGNPPFLSQLKRQTARNDSGRARLAERWPGVGRYVDDAMAFALASVDAVASSGTVVLVQPASMLGAADAESARAHLDTNAPLVGLWIDHARRFAAAVDTVAIVLRRGEAGDEVRLDERAVPRPSARSWAPLLAADTGTPALILDRARTIGDVARVTAGFRDQFYGLRGAVDDDASARHPLVTSGAIDPLRLRWGQRPTRFDKRSYLHPSVDLDRVDPKIRGWVEDRLVPKVVVASQTKVIEAVADVDGVLVPCTPVVSLEPIDGEIGPMMLAALMTSPVATALLVQVAAGTALSADAVRVSARLLAELPLPTDEAAWVRAAALAEVGDVLGCGRAMLNAHGLGDGSDILEWWKDRIPTSSLGI